MTYSGPPFGYTVPDGYTFDGVGRCASCGVDIAWCITRKGNRAPLDPSGISHFATCPNAADHRQPKPTARRTDPGTSHGAARDVSRHAERHRDIALAALREAGPAGLTDFELADRTGIAQTSIGVRRNELVKAGRVEATARRRAAPSGSLAIVWRAKP